MLTHTVHGHNRGEAPAFISVVVIKKTKTKNTNIKQRRAVEVCFREGYSLFREVKLVPSTGQNRGRMDTHTFTA